VPGLPGETVVTKDALHDTPYSLWRIPGDLALIHIATGHAQRLTQGDTLTEDYWLSPDGKWVAYFVPRYFVGQSQLQNGDLHLIDVEKATDRVVAKDLGNILRTCVSRRTAAVGGRADVADTRSRSETEQKMFFLYDVAAQRPRDDLVPFEDVKYSKEGYAGGAAPLWSGDSSEFYYNYDGDDTGTIWRIRLTGGGAQPLARFEGGKNLTIIADGYGTTFMTSVKRDCLFVTARDTKSGKSTIARIFPEDRRDGDPARSRDEH